MSTSSSRTICWICYEVAAPNLKGILRHMAAVHAHDPNFSVCCGIEGCTRTYFNFYSFKKHLYRKHRCSLEMMHPFVSNSPLDMTGGDAEEVVSVGERSDLPVDGDQPDKQLPSFEYMKQTSLFLLKVKEIWKVSQVALDGLIADVTSMLQRTINQIKHEVSTVLQSNGVSLSTFSGLEDVFNDPRWNEPFKGLDSVFLQEKFYQEHLNVLVSL